MNTPEWVRFPTDELSLTLLEAACNINPDTGHTELMRFLEIGAVVKSITNEETGEVFLDRDAALEAWDGDDAPVFFVEHESALHSPHTVIISLIEEIRRLHMERDHYIAETARYRDHWDSTLGRWGMSILRRKRSGVS